MAPPKLPRLPRFTDVPVVTANDHIQPRQPSGSTTRASSPAPFYTAVGEALSSWRPYVIPPTLRNRAAATSRILSRSPSPSDRSSPAPAATDATPPGSPEAPDARFAAETPPTTDAPEAAAANRSFFPPASAANLTARRGGLYGSLLLDALTSARQDPLHQGEPYSMLFLRLAQQQLPDRGSDVNLGSRCMKLGEDYANATQIMDSMGIDLLTLPTLEDAIERLIQKGLHATPVLDAAIELELTRRARDGEPADALALLRSILPSEKQRRAILARIRGQGVEARVGEYERSLRPRPIGDGMAAASPFATQGH